MPKESRRSTESVEELKRQIAHNQEKIRRMKRMESELNLTEYEGKFTSTDIATIEKIIKACYDYIAQHRALLKQKDNFVELDE